MSSALAIFICASCIGAGFVVGVWFTLKRAHRIHRRRVFEYGVSMGEEISGRWYDAAQADERSLSPELSAEQREVVTRALDLTLSYFSKALAEKFPEAWKQGSDEEER